MSKNHRVVIPANIVRGMSLEDRRRYGVRTAEEQAAHDEMVVERTLHSQFSSWLFRNKFMMPYHSDMSRRPTIAAGIPDFGIHRDGKILFIEFKVGKNQLNEAQEKCFAEMGAQGDVILVCHSYEEAVRATRNFFNLPWTFLP
jgi:hypothetical protein